ncbi:tyrosine-type recombinase/integrase [Halosimplex amylolyticum]|uniref:tyrosine-type recombinase/integrase n=1 Tax=Halosimplex amylolyticum TaxID=3396616 RepID=UPI003F5651D6
MTGSNRNRPDFTPREARRRYLDHRKTEASASSIKSWASRLKRFCDWADDQPDIETMRDLDGWKLDEWENHRRGQGVASSTLNSEMQTVKNWVEYLARIEVVDDELPEKVHVPEVPDGEESNDEMLEHGAARSLIKSYRNGPDRATANHALLELLWFTGARLGGVRALDLDDYHPGEQYVEFRHRPDTGTPLKNDSDGERAVGLPASTCVVLDEYIDRYRSDVYERGRQPFLTTARGRPGENTVRVWCYMATMPCLYQDCPHGHRRDTCEFVHVHHASKCPSSLSPHRVRTGSITWQRDQGLPAEIVAKRVNATLEVIESYYDKATERQRLERRRRPYIENLQFDPED